MNNQNLKETYNRIAKDWSKDHEGHDWWKEGADVFISLLSKNSTVLDVGCGSGDKTKYINDQGLIAEGIDFSEGMIECAKQKFPQIKFEVLDIYDLEKINKKFNGIFAQAVLLHIPKKKVIEVLEKLKSKVEENGIFYIAVKEIRDEKIEEEIKKENDYGYDYERFFSYYTLEELRKYFNIIGFEIVYENIVNSGRSNWINIIGKK